MAENIIKKIQSLFSHIYLRYLLITELYMVEPWERIVMYVIFISMFSAFWYFNYSIVIGGIRNLRGAEMLHEVS